VDPPSCFGEDGRTDRGMSPSLLFAPFVLSRELTCTVNSSFPQQVPYDIRPLQQYRPYRHTNQDGYGALEQVREMSRFCQCKAVGLCMIQVPYGDALRKIRLLRRRDCDSIKKSPYSRLLVEYSVRNGVSPTSATTMRWDSPWIKYSWLYSWSNRSRVASVRDQP
jgi:hypothetical protein